MLVTFKKYRIYLSLVLLLICHIEYSKGQHGHTTPGKYIFTTDLEQGYYFPEGTKFSPQVPSPRAFFGRQIGHQHTRYDQVLQYLKELERTSNRVQLDTIGYSWEGRPLVVLKISAVRNLNNLDRLHQAHVEQIGQAKKGQTVMAKDGPAFVFLGFSVHGNESSAADASLLIAYYLSAAIGPEVDRYLEEGVYFVDAVRNPDGYDRYVNWVNANTTFPPVNNAVDREHNEPWPGGRTNHYWFDLNRDWVNQVHPESKARVSYFQKWLPHFQGDFHEMGANSTYFFEPTKAEAQESIWVPKSTYELNRVFATYYARALDTIGSLYYTKEQFDNINPTYGSSYPDHAGSLGILFEQASPRGLIQHTATGDLTYPFAIRNHVRIALASVLGAVENRRELQENQLYFFRSALDLAAKDPVKAYVVDGKNNERAVTHFAELLGRHQIDFVINDQDRTIDGQVFEKEHSIIVPTSQANYRLIKVIFDEAKEYIDSVFYDGSANSIAYLYGFKYAPLKQWVGKSSAQRVEVQKKILSPVRKSNYAYVVDWEKDNAPWLLSQLLAAGIRIKTSTGPFTIATDDGNVSFGYGSFVIPVSIQDRPLDSLYTILQELSNKSHIKIHAANTGLSITGVDFGSNNLKTVKPQQALLITGRGISAYEAGEVWHSFEQYLGQSVLRVDIDQFARLDLENYQVAVLVNGDYGVLDKAQIEKLAAWTKSGNTLIALGRAGQWLTNQNITTFKFAVDKPDTTAVKKPRYPYASSHGREGAKRIGGAFFRTEIDTTHPIGYGYSDVLKPVYRNHAIFVEQGTQPYNNVAVYTKSPLLNGYVSKENQKNLEGTSSILVENIGAGRVVYFVENPLFRGVSFGNARSFFNAVLLGQLIQGPNRR